MLTPFLLLPAALTLPGCRSQRDQVCEDASVVAPEPDENGLRYPDVDCDASSIWLDGEPRETFPDALDEASHGSVITVCDVQSSVPLTVEGEEGCTRSLVVEGLGMAAFNGIPGERPITVRNANLELAGFLVTGRDVGALDRGGVALVESGSLTLRNVTLMGGEADQGGGIFADASSSLSLLSSTLHSLTADEGGAVYAEESVLVEGGEIRDNSSDGASAIHVDGALTVRDADLHANDSDARITLYGGSVTLENTLLYDNDDGGVVSGGDTVVSRTTIDEVYGVALRSEGPATLTRLTTGADLQLSGGEIRNSDFSDVAVSSEGGDLKVAKCTFAMEVGSTPPLQASGTSLTVTDSEFAIGASADATAIVARAPIVVLDGVLISGASIGLDVFGEGDGQVTLTDTTIADGDHGLDAWQKTVTCEGATTLLRNEVGAYVDDGTVAGCVIRDGYHGLHTYNPSSVMSSYAATAAAPSGTTERT